MARVEYRDVDDISDGLEEIIESVAAQRGGVVPNLYRLLLHCPDIATAWLQLGTSLREVSLSHRQRELAICVVSATLGCTYLCDHHAPLAVHAGLGWDQLRGISSDGPNDLFSGNDRLIVEIAKSISGAGRVSDSVFSEAQEALSEQAIVELVATVAFYNCVARFLLALEVDHDPVTPGV